MFGFILALVSVQPVTQTVTLKEAVIVSKAPVQRTCEVRELIQGSGTVKVCL